MKKIVLTLLLAAAASASVFAQGTVTFANTTSVFNTVADRFVYFDATGIPANLVKGTQYKAQLYVSTTLGGTYIAVDANPVPFRVTTTTSAGTWNPGAFTTKVIPAPIGTLDSDVFLKVVAWDGTVAATFEASAGLGVYRGASQAFAYHIPPTGSASGAYAMDNFRAFAIIVPEPGTFALGGLGLLGLCLWRRRK